MTQRSLHWDGSTIGDANLLTENVADGIGYRLGNANYESPLVDRMFRMLWNGDEDRGVLKGWLNELAVTGVATPVAVDTGGAVVYGMPYENTSSVNVAVTTPTTDTRQDLIVLRRNWSAQTIRITKIDGVEGGSAPSATQSPDPTGTGIYDIPLASISTTTGGVITVTDLREYCQFGTGIADDALDTTHLTNNSIDFADRATREQVLFIGASGMEAMPHGALFTGGQSQSLLPIPPWNGAANESGYRFTGTGGTKGVITSLWLPFANWASGAIETYYWWVPNASGSASCYLRAQTITERLYADGRGYGLGNTSYDSAYLSGTITIHSVERTQGIILAESSIAAYQSNNYNHCTHGIWWYNSSGTEDIDLLGIEYRYTGYV